MKQKTQSPTLPSKIVTLVMGSTRKNGSTHILLNEAARAIHAHGIATEIVYPDDLALADCRGCHRCKTGNDMRCVIRDDMQEVYCLMERSCGLVVAAPVYFGYVPAMTKAWLDRLVPYIGPDMSPQFPNPYPVSFIFTQNVPDPGCFEVPLSSFVNGVAMTGLSVRDCLIAPDCEAGVKTPVAERPELMARAYGLGRDLVQGI